MSKDTETRKQIDATTDRIVASHSSQSKPPDRSAVRESVRLAFIRNERQGKNR